MSFLSKNCILCESKHFFWQSYCSDCRRLFGVVQKNLGHVGLSQLMDELIATGIAKPRIMKFLEADPHGRGSLMDQILAQLSNNLASGIGVKGKDMTPADVKRIRTQPMQSASTKPLDE